MRFKSVIAGFLGSTFAAYLIVSLILLIMLSPLFLTLATSFKTLQEIFSWPPTIFPKNPTFEAYKEIFLRGGMSFYLVNSLIISLTTTAIVTIVGMLTAYGLSQYQFKGSRTVLLLFLGSRIIPPVSLIVPFYIVFSYLRLINTYTVLIIINIFLCYPLGVWMLKSFFDSFPKEILNAARIDGCSRIGAFFRVMVPISAGGISAIAIITFLWTWNEFMFAMLFTNTPAVRPITVGAFDFIGDEYVQWNSVAAVAMLATAPGLTFFAIAQRAIVKGLTQGAIKG